MRPPRLRRRLPILIILLVACGLRAWQLDGVPPGLTHDEANHGREGMSILDGDLRLYYPLNYGSEPLYSYTVAGSMAALGENPFALRLVGLFFGLLTIAAVYAWAGAAFDRRTAFLTAGLIAVAYWPLVASRMALRATLLPFFTLLAAWFFWRLIRAARQPNRPIRWGEAAGFGLFLGATFYIYLASRVLWLAFALFVPLLFAIDRPLARRLWRPALAGLILAGLLVVPMFVYLDFYPEAETRLQMLEGPVRQALDGNLAPVWRNGWQALAAFFWPGFGDRFLAYNIPGRPVFGPITALLALIGLLTCLRRWRRPAAAFTLLWLAIGLIPSLITGPTANTTRNIGALPVVYLLPALGALAVGRFLQPSGRLGPIAVRAAAVLWLAAVGFQTARDYFFIWARDPDVRAAYQTTIIAAVETAGELPPGAPVLFSSVYPGGAHDTSIARVVAAPAEKERPVRWMDARRALLFPAGTGDGAVDLLAPASADLHPVFQGWAAPAGRVEMAPDDLDPFFTRYRIAPPAAAGSPLARFDGAIDLLDARWLAGVSPPELLTVWRVRDPARAGPIVWPLETTDVVLFVHVLRPDGTILTQEDRLDAPSWGWQAGDLLVQVFRFDIPAETPAGTYRAVTGVYDRQSSSRLRLEEGGDDFAPLPPLVISSGE